MPALPRHHQRRCVSKVVGELAACRLGGRGHLLLGRAPLAVGAAQLRGDLGRPLRVLGEEQLHPRIGPVEAPRRVDPRRQPKRQVPLIELRRLDLGRGQQGADPGPLRPPNLLQSPPHDRPVLPDQRHHVGHRRQRDEVEIAPRVDPLSAVASFQATAVPHRSVKGYPSISGWRIGQSGSSPAGWW